MITCPYCGEHLIVFLDIPGDRYAVPEQPEPSTLMHRFQACCTCKTHTHQTLVQCKDKPGRGRWTCSVCGNHAQARWPMPVTDMEENLK